jgi:sulfite exporter TauE/SafE
MFLSFLIGLSSSFHCLGMCGPIAMSIPIGKTSPFKKIIGILQYNFGRVFAYFLFGIIVGFVGMSIASFKFLQWVSIIAGIVMILIAWKQFYSVFKINFSEKILHFISSNIGIVLRSNFFLKLIFLGFLNGLLPCGMVYAGLLNALIQGSILKGGMSMILFGIGTIPMMFSVSFFSNIFYNSLRKKYSKFIPYFITLVGLLIILRGLNLGIPYLSPKIQNTETTSNKNIEENKSDKKIELICCKPKNNNKK